MGIELSFFYGRNRPSGFLPLHLEIVRGEGPGQHALLAAALPTTNPLVDPEDIGHQLFPFFFFFSVERWGSALPLCNECNGREPRQQRRERQPRRPAGERWGWRAVVVGTGDGVGSTGWLAERGNPRRSAPRWTKKRTLSCEGRRRSFVC